MLKSTFHGTLEWLCAEVGDAVAFQMLRSCEGLPTAFNRAGKSPVIIVFPARTEKQGTVITHTTRRVDSLFKILQNILQTLCI